VGLACAWLFLLFFAAKYQQSISPQQKSKSPSASLSGKCGSGPSLFRSRLRIGFG
jgi:hypothetical protein